MLGEMHKNVKPWAKRKVLPDDWTNQYVSLNTDLNHSTKMVSFITKKYLLFNSKKTTKKEQNFAAYKFLITIYKKPALVLYFNW